MNARLVVLTDADSGKQQCINVAHVLTFKPSGNWTLITFTNGDTLVARESFADVVKSLAGQYDAVEGRAPEIEMVEQVTIEHGLAFAQSWYDGDGDIIDACTHAGIMTWPGESEEQKEAHARFLDIEDEICANVFGLLKRQTAEAFVRAANEVLDREHGK